MMFCAVLCEMSGVVVAVVVYVEEEGNVAVVVCVCVVGPVVVFCSRAR